VSHLANPLAVIQFAEKPAEDQAQAARPLHRAARPNPPGGAGGMRALPKLICLAALA
jgi:hypothetical protein